MSENEVNHNRLSKRFRGFFPVIVDVETAGFNHETDALLELAAVTVKMDENGICTPDKSCHFHIKPFEGANLDENALAFTGIRPFHPLRLAVDEQSALNDLFKFIRTEKNEANCPRAVLVGQNACFDLNFVNAAIHRTKIKRNPFHGFTVFDTATLSALAYGQTTLPRALEAAGIPYDNKEAHSAKYDAMVTAELFCAIVNRWKDLGGWPLGSHSDEGEP
ncbi:MAG: ribonuclease T [Legionellales bacterium]|nr:ribonuclease T [Legionellales bacterium]|tara:strand:- start:418 stop:1077 length:660 start_codon:yes stop_codon:yes gene_type:complete